MISFGVVGDAAKAAAYYCDLANAAEYYSGGSERVPSRWLGTGAALQGLRGPVGHDALTDQLNGKVCDASGGERHLGIQREGRWQHRAGWDLTVSAPKSVSIEALVHDRRDVIEAHRKAVVVALSYMEQHAAQARIGGKTVKTGNLTAAAYDHVSSRSGDPQLHTHLLISNVTYGRDGVARSLSNEELLRSRRAADAVYHQTLSYQLQRLGYAVTHDRHGRVEIADYDRAQLLDMSTRTAEIEKALAARGLTTETASPQVKQIIIILSL